jgi:hypothetical protein
VPRDLSFEDVSATVRAAYYRTAGGTPVRAVAIDAERGEDFMGAAPGVASTLWQYVGLVRRSLGRRYPIVTDVEDPYLEHLDNATYPYAAIARYSSALQPMVYWRMARGATTPEQVREIVRASYAALRRLAGRPVPISVGGQTAAEGRGGAPAPGEITASLQTSRAIGAIGECFFSWDGTGDAQWRALSQYSW